jgi:hypothetical protein
MGEHENPLVSDTPDNPEPEREMSSDDDGVGRFCVVRLWKADKLTFEVSRVPRFADDWSPWTATVAGALTVCLGGDVGPAAVARA